jgi:hypothetical protein
LVVSVEFPILYIDPTDPQSTVYVIDSLRSAEGGELEYFDVKDENFVIWDSHGVRVHAAVRDDEVHWLELTATGTEDMQGLREAISRYAESTGVPATDLQGLTPFEAVRRIEEVAQQRDRERRRARRWYQFWRSG